MRESMAAGRLETSNLEDVLNKARKKSPREFTERQEYSLKVFFGGTPVNVLPGLAEWRRKI